MIPGYNHNVKYKERVYHVQTEDSGVQNPHIITHLFVGGNIVESRKTSYAELLGSDRLSTELVDLMQGQHKGMLKDLINGRFDEKIIERSKNAATLNGPAPLNVDAGAQHRASFGIGGDTPAAKPALSPSPSAKAATPASAPAQTLPPVASPTAAPTPAAARPPSAPAAPRPVQPSPFAQAPKPPPTPPATPAAPRPPPLPAQPAAAVPATPPARPVPPPTPSRAPAQPIAAQAAPPTFGAPPPARVSVIPTAAGVPAAITRPVPPPAPIAVAPQTQTTAEQEASGMVIEAEALARAFESKDESAVDSIFGEDLISEKSLDEVILSYLADDLQKE